MDTQPDVTAPGFFHHLPIRGGAAVTDRCGVASGPEGDAVRTCHLVLGVTETGSEISIDVSDPAYLRALAAHARRGADWLEPHWYAA